MSNETFPRKIKETTKFKMECSKTMFFFQINKKVKLNSKHSVELIH